FAVRGIDDLAHHENADPAVALREDGNVIGGDLRLVRSFLAAPMIREAPFEDRQQIRPLRADFLVHGKTGGVLARAAASRLAHAHQADDLREIDMKREFAPACIAASTFRLAGRGFVADQAKQIAARALRHAPAEMSAKRPNHRADVLVRIACDGNAANDDDAAPLLDLVENPSEIGIEGGMAAMHRLDLTKPEPLLTKPVQQLLESRGVPSGQFE